MLLSNKCQEILRDTIEILKRENTVLQVECDEVKTRQFIFESDLLLLQRKVGDFEDRITQLQEENLVLRNEKSKLELAYRKVKNLNTKYRLMG